MIAVGSPAGVPGSVLYGNLVSSGHTVSVIDGEYELLLVCPLISTITSPCCIPASIAGEFISTPVTYTPIDGEYELLLTDMPKASESSGVLVNPEGQIVGIIQARNLRHNIHIIQNLKILYSLRIGVPDLRVNGACLILHNHIFVGFAVFRYRRLFVLAKINAGDPVSL